MRASALLLAALPGAGATQPHEREVQSDVDDIPALLAQIPALAGTEFDIEVLHGGLTNRNYALTGADGRKLVLRRSDPQSALLAIDRDCEHRNAPRPRPRPASAPRSSATCPGRACWSSSGSRPAPSPTPI